MELEREGRLVSTNRKLSMGANRFALSYIPVHGRGAHPRPTRVRDYGTKGFPAFTWLECKSSPRDEFTVFFPLPLPLNVRVFTWAELLIVLHGPIPLAESRPETVRFKKILTRYGHVQWDTGDSSHRPIQVESHASNWHVNAGRLQQKYDYSCRYSNVRCMPDKYSIISQTKPARCDSMIRTIKKFSTLK